MRLSLTNEPLTWRQSPQAATLKDMKKRSPTRKARGVTAPGDTAGEQLTLPQAAELIGMDPAALAGFIREAGLEPAGPESEWRLEAADVLKLKAERAKLEQRNLAELAKAARGLE